MEFESVNLTLFIPHVWYDVSKLASILYGSSSVCSCSMMEDMIDT